MYSLYELIIIIIIMAYQAVDVPVEEEERVWGQSSSRYVNITEPSFCRCNNQERIICLHEVWIDLKHQKMIPF